MRIVLANFRLRDRGGSETYLLCLGSELQRLGHHVVAYSMEAADESSLAEEHGLAFAPDPSKLPEHPDAIVAQDAVVAYALADRFPGVPQLFVAHSYVRDLQIPPQLPGVVGGVVALNAGMARWLEALASRPEIVRLRQPVKLDYVPMPKPLPSRPTKLLSLGNRLTRERRADLMYACAKLGMAYEELGKQVGRNIDPAGAIADATIVVGYGRSIIEAMAAGRAAYVYDHRGGDGWVTPSTWERIEATGFLGATGTGPTDRDALVKDLAAYDPQMGADNWKLARRHHAVSLHAKAIVDLLRRLAPSYPPPSQAEELSRLARISWDHERKATKLRPLENRVVGLESRLAEERKRSRELRTKLESRLAEERKRSRELRTMLREIRSSKIYRLLASVRRLGRRTLIRSR